MAVRVTPEEGQKLLARGYTFIDVRSEPEFAQDHVPGAFNVPLMHPRGDSLEENADFLRVMQACFDKDAALLVGCMSGARSMRAAAVLAQAGFSNIADLRTGIEGCRDEFGTREPGWRSKNLPLESGISEPQSYVCCRRRAGID